jgi:GntR family transcriptional regulator/MocR family aminotransferase
MKRSTFDIFDQSTLRTPITLDRRKSTPLHRQVYDELRRGILAGRLRPGDRMPSTRELAVTVKVARATVTTAYDQLVAEGYLEGHHGSGTFVCRELPARPLGRARPAIAPAPGGDIRLSGFVTRLGPWLPRAAVPPGVIDLSSIDTDSRLFPSAVWNRLVRRHLRQGDPGLYRYATDSAGHLPLRETIASYLGRSRAVSCRPEQVVVVNGSQQAIDLCARVLVDAGDHMMMEEPGYPEARRLFAAAGATVRPVPVDEDGVVVSAIPPQVRLAHVTPSHQFPSGVSLSLARRLELLAWTRAAQAVVIENDYDSEFRYVGTPLPSLQGLGDASRVVYLGTFSLALFPGLRLGYLVLPPALVEPFLRAKWHADRHTAPLDQAVLADFIREGHLERHIRRMRRVYKRRREALLDAIHRHFGDRATVVGDAAGLHVVVRFAGPSLASRAARSGVALAGTRAHYAGKAPDNEFIFRFSGASERVLAEGVRRLAGAA